MGNGMNRVLPGLFVGNYRDSKDAGQLERHKISHIVAIHDAARRLHSDKEYLCIMASDTPYQNLAQYFPTCNDFIHTARLQGGSVLIHCLAGMSRSVTIVVAYIMSITSLRWNEALKVVRGARAVSNPNSGFQKQLLEFEVTRLSDERRRLLEKFPGTSQLDHDEENCRRLLIAYDHLLLSKAICEGRCASARICPTGTCRPHCASPRFSRQRSNENSSSPRGSTKSLDITGTEPPQSPRSWERHYGCWKNHLRNQQGSNSTPASPILYRASKSGNHRSDSMLSISSISSITSLPGQISLEKESPCISLVDRSPLLSSQSCPNSPRRMPRRMEPTQSQLGLGSGVSHTNVSRILSKDSKIVTTSNTTPSTSTSSLSMSTAATAGPGPSWGTPPTSPCHRFMAHNAASGKSGTARNTVRVASGITRWVMKRSAYKFNLDKS